MDKCVLAGFVNSKLYFYMTETKENQHVILHAFVGVETGIRIFCYEMFLFFQSNLKTREEMRFLHDGESLAPSLDVVVYR